MFISPNEENDRDVDSLFGRKYLEEKSEEVQETEDDYNFSFKKHWKDDEDKTAFDSKPMGGFKDW